MKNKTSLEWISELVLRLTTIAHDPETWESYKAVGTDTKAIVIDRTDNNIARYIRECEIHFSALYDADMKQDTELAAEKQANLELRKLCGEAADFCLEIREYYGVKRLSKAHSEEQFIDKLRKAAEGEG